MSFRRALAYLIALTLLMPLVAVAQTVTGTMHGTVTDKTGAALPGVTVTIRNLETALERVVVTNGEGFFNAPFLAVGRYRVTAELAGLGSMSRQNVPVELNQTTVQDFSLAPAVSETITVQADAPRINVTDGEIKQTMRSDEIMNIPTGDQQNFLQLATVFSGFQENINAAQDNPTLSTGSSINFNGAGTRGTTFQINGVNNDDSSENQHRQGVALATIKSFQVLTNSFSSEFGRGYGAVVLVQTKSGTNSLAGEVYGYGRHAKYNERSYFVKHLPKSDSYRRQFGFTAGFPIMRDALFGFVNADHTEVGGGDFVVRGLFLPSDLALPRLTLNNNTPENRAWQDAIMARWPKGATPNAPDQNARSYRYTQEVDFPDRDYSGRVDWNALQNLSLTGRYQRSHQKRDANEVILGERANQDNRQSNFGLTFNHVITANTVHEARYGLGLRDTNVNISTGNDTPVVRLVGLMPGSLSFTLLGNAGNFPILRNQRDQQFVYNLSTARWDRHTLKVGTDLRRSSLDDRADNFNRGFWSFGSNCGGVAYPSAMHAFMAGCVTTFQKSYGPNELKNDLWEANVYAQDDWRLRDNLIFNVGVRYERVGVPEEEDGKVDYQYNDTDYVDPRLGFAYTPDWERNRFLRAVTGGNGRFSIRGGFGVYHGRVFQSVFSQGGANVRYNPPNARFLTISGSNNLADPTNGFVFVPGQPLTGPVDVTLIDPDLQMPETRQWNLTFERQVMQQARLRLSYVGTIGKGLLQYRVDNQPVMPGAPGSQFVVAQDWQCAGTGTPGVAITATCPRAVPIAPNEISVRVPRVQQRRPDQRYGQVLTVVNGADSSYHAGQLEFETGMWRGLAGRMTYTFSKAIDSGSEATSFGAGDVNIFPDYESFKRGLSRFDTRHRFTMTGYYQIPFFRNRDDWKGNVLGGWQLSTVIRLASGTPFTITDSGAFDIDFDNVGNRRPICIDPKYCGGWSVNNRNTSQSEMPRSAFRRATPNDRIEDLLGRNTFFTDGSESVDLGVYKMFRLPLKNSLLVRLDMFNVFDHVTWGLPNTDWASADFGRITTTRYTPRTFQLGLRFIY